MTRRYPILHRDGRVQRHHLRRLPSKLGYKRNKDLGFWYKEPKKVPGATEWYRVQITLLESQSDKRKSKGPVAGVVVDVEMPEDATDDQIEQRARQIARVKTMGHADSVVAHGMTALLGEKHGKVHEYDTETIVGVERIKKEKVREWTWF